MCGWGQSAGFLLRVLFLTNMRQRRSFSPKMATKNIKETNTVRALTRKLKRLRLTVLANLSHKIHVTVVFSGLGEPPISRYGINGR